MSTGQKYLGKGGTANPFEPLAAQNPQTAPNEAQPSTAGDDWPAPVSIDEFLARFKPQNQLMTWEVAPYLDLLLTNQPISYSSIIDVIPLLRTFLPASGADADYAILIRDQAIVGFVWLGAESYQEVTSLNARLLMGAILALDIKSIVLASTYSVQDSAFDDVRTRDIDSLGDSFYQFGVSLNDWLHVHPAHTESYMLAAHGEESIGLAQAQVTACYNHCTFPYWAEIEEEDENNQGHE